MFNFYCSLLLILAKKNSHVERKGKMREEPLHAYCIREKKLRELYRMTHERKAERRHKKEKRKKKGNRWNHLPLEAANQSNTWKKKERSTQDTLVHAAACSNDRSLSRSWNSDFRKERRKKKRTIAGSLQLSGSNGEMGQAHDRKDLQRNGAPNRASDREQFPLYLAFSEPDVRLARTFPSSFFPRDGPLNRERPINSRIVRSSHWFVPFSGQSFFPLIPSFHFSVFVHFSWSTFFCYKIKVNQNENIFHFFTFWCFIFLFYISLI